MERILIWGTGRTYEKWCFVVHSLVDEKRIDILALINRETKQKKLNGYRVITKDEIEKYDFDKIVVMAEGTAEDSILEDIKELQIDDDKIISSTRFLQKYCGNKYFSNNLPCIEFLELVKSEKEKKGNIVVAEIGVDVGSTAVEVCKLLETDDIYYCFDFEDKTSELIKYLKEVEEICCHLIEKGNSHKTFDSYCWSLSNLLFEMRNSDRKGLFDIVYLDGAHNFMHDGLACCILKELLKPNGYIIFDDVLWTYGNSPTCNPDVFPGVKELYTDEQIYDRQVQRVIDTFMVKDAGFRQIFIETITNPSRAIFQKCQMEY